MLHSFYCWGHAGASEQAVSQWASAFAEKGLGISKTEGDSPVPLLSLVFCALCGLSVGMMWPGTFSKASAALPRDGMAMFALLALGGDIGCSGGPTVVGMASGILGDNLKIGILAGIIFPVLLLIGILLCRRIGGKP